MTDTPATDPAAPAATPPTGRSWSTLSPLTLLFGAVGVAVIITALGDTVKLPSPATMLIIGGLAGLLVALLRKAHWAAYVLLAGIFTVGVLGHLGGENYLKAYFTASAVTCDKQETANCPPAESVAPKLTDQTTGQEGQPMTVSFSTLPWWVILLCVAGGVALIGAIIALRQSFAKEWQPFVTWLLMVLAITAVAYVAPGVIQQMTGEKSVVEAVKSIDEHAILLLLVGLGLLIALGKMLADVARGQGGFGASFFKVTLGGMAWIAFVGAFVTVVMIYILGEKNVEQTSLQIRQGYEDSLSNGRLREWWGSWLSDPLGKRAPKVVLAKRIVYKSGWLGHLPVGYSGNFWVKKGTKISFMPAGCTYSGEMKLFAKQVSTSGKVTLANVGDEDIPTNLRIIAWGTTHNGHHCNDPRKKS